MRVEGRYGIHDPQFIAMNFLKNIRVIPLRSFSIDTGSKACATEEKNLPCRDFLFDNIRLSGY
jgi:hypothetical protein